MSQNQPEINESDSEGHTTEEPREGTHASGEVAAVNLLDNEDVLFLGRSNAEIDDDYSSHSDATILGLGGDPIIGSFADSDGESGTVGPVLICEESDGQICLGILFADTTATEDEDSSEATADTGLAWACVGGDNPDATGSEDCGPAPITAGVSEAHSSATADKTDGSQTADQETTLADVCIGPEGQVAGVCSGLGAEAVSSESHSSIEDENGNGTTTDDTGETSRESSILGVQIAGAPAADITDEQALVLPPGDCTQALLCLFLNQGRSFAGVGGAASRQEAIHIAALVSDQLPGGQVVLAHLGTAETRVEGMDRECPPGTVFNPDTGECDVVEEFCPDGVTPIPPGGLKDCPGGGDVINCPDGTVLTGPNKTRADCPGGGGDITERGGGLALTGGSLLPLLAVSMILAAGGTGALATERRRRRP